MVLLIEPTGARTIIGSHPDLLHCLTIPVTAVSPRDIVYLAAWRNIFTPAVQALAAQDAQVAGVPPEATSATRYLIGSRNDFAAIPPPEATAVVTDGANGVTVYPLGRKRPLPSASRRSCRRRWRK
ncbi:hypothetical protein GCM10023334_012280 [Nonomuraea thailandensis]